MEFFYSERLLNEFPSAHLLITHLKELDKKLDFDNTHVYHHFPVYLNDEAKCLKMDLFLISKKFGVFIFKCLDFSERTLEKENITDAKEDLEDTYSNVYSKLLKSRLLRKNVRDLAFDIKPVLFFSNYSGQIRFDLEWPELSIVNDLSSLENTIKETSNHIEDEYFNEIISILEGSKNLAIKAERTSLKEDKQTKGQIIDQIETAISTFDSEQKRAGFQIIDGPQRIRGLAGSGKTVILAMKAAQIHLTEPDSQIVFTYWTKSLYDYVKNLITRFYRQFTPVDPNWDNIHIMHSWGGKNLEGLYYTACIENGYNPKTLHEGRKLGSDPFNEVCKLIEKEDLKELYDYILIDEAQDFPTYFYRLCRKIARNDRIIWAYDECQNILDISIQNTVETFGKDSAGKAYIDFANASESNQDIVLHKCYRNPRKVLASAFALGMGIYSDIVQLPENKELWTDWGFEVISGNYNTNDNMKIIRPEKNSPLLKNRLIDEDHPIKWKFFDHIEEECSYVTKRILDDLKEGLKPEDILVISLDDKYARSYFDLLSTNLKEYSIQTFNLLTAPYYSTQFFNDNEITLSTVYRAKGNEAAQVYIVGVDGIFSNKFSKVSRNKIFTAMTRAKAWVDITGVGTFAEEFCDEMNQIVENDYELNFQMPDLSELALLQRDLEKRQATFNETRRLIEEKSHELGMDKDEFLKNISKYEQADSKAKK